MSALVPDELGPCNDKSASECTDIYDKKVYEYSNGVQEPDSLEFQTVGI